MSYLSLNRARRVLSKILGKSASLPAPSKPADPAMAYRKSGDLNAAEAAIREALRQHPSSKEVIREAAEIAMARGNWEEAAASWRSALALYGQAAPADLHRKLGKALRRSGDLEAAEDAVVEGKRQHPRDPRLIREAAEIATRRRDWANAVPRWRQVCDLWRSNTPLESSARSALFEACKQLAFASRFAGQIDAASAQLKELIAQRKSIAQRSATFRPSAEAAEICFILSEAHRGWILERIARVIAKSSGAKCDLTYLPSISKIAPDVPAAHRYFFMHYRTLCSALLDRNTFWKVPAYCWFTHPNADSPIDADHLPLFLNEIEHTFVQGSRSQEQLRRAGGDPNRLSVAIGGADPDTYLGHARSNGKLGFVGGYYERKNPGMLLQLARAMPEEQFLLLGPRLQDISHRGIYWPNAPMFAEIVAQPNIEYREAAYQDFPAHFAEIDVYLMLSSLEGGPIPLLEAMMSNCIPVATDTGFAGDVIEHGMNGYLTAVDSDASSFIELIRKAKANQSDVRATVLEYSWSAFGEAVARRVLSS